MVTCEVAIECAELCVITKARCTDVYVSSSKMPQVQSGFPQIQSDEIRQNHVRVFS